MSRTFVLALLLLGVCLTSTSEAQLFRRGIFRARQQPNYYAQPAYRQQQVQGNRYAVQMTDRFGRRYYQYYVQPNSNQAYCHRPSGNQFAQQMYGQNASQVARIPSAVAPAAPTENQPVIAQTQATAPANPAPTETSILQQGDIYVEGPEIIGPVGAEVPVPGGIPPTSEVIPATDIPTVDPNETKEGGFSILEKVGGGQ